MNSIVFAGFLWFLPLTDGPQTPLTGPSTFFEPIPLAAGQYEPNEPLVDLLDGLTPYKGDTETPQERRSRMGIIAQALESAAGRVSWPGSKSQLVTALISLGVFETHLAQHIHEGNCRPYECDHGRAASLWQIQHGPHISKRIWEDLQGDDLESTILAASWAAHFLAKGLASCKSLRGAYAMYATGKTCSWPPGAERAEYAQQLLYELRDK